MSTVVPAEAFARPDHQQRAPYQQSISQCGVRSKVVAGFLAFFLGGLGVHGFYLGNTGMGITLLVVSIVSWMAMVGGILFSFLVLPILFVFAAMVSMGAIWILTLVQAIVYWTSTDIEFNDKFVIGKRWF